MKISKRSIFILVALAALGFVFLKNPTDRSQSDLKGLQAEQANLAKELQEMKARVDALSNGYTQTRGLMEKIVAAIKAQQLAIEQLDRSIKETKTKAVAVQPPTQKAPVRAPASSRTPQRQRR